MRKIIQISTDSINDGGQLLWAGTTALCDDGTVWDINQRCTDPHWVALPPIPQDDATAETEVGG